MVFLFLGIGVFAFEHKYEEMGVGTFLFTVLNLNIARALNVQIVSWWVNRSRSEKSKIPSTHKLVMWVAGLRGAMAYALAMESSKNPIFTDPAAGRWAGNVMLLVTLLYSLFTILGVSSFLNPIMTKCEVTRASAESAPVEDRNATEAALISSIEEQEREKKCCTRLKARLSRFDKYIFSPLFVKDSYKVNNMDGRLEDPNKKLKDDIDFAISRTHRSNSLIIKTKDK